MKIIEAFEKGLIPADYKDIVPTKCEVCGEDLDVSENLKTMCCPNPYCLNKMSNRLEEMLKNFGIVGNGSSYCELLADALMEQGIESHLGIFTLELKHYPNYYGSVVTREKYLTIQGALKKFNETGNLLTYGQLVKNLALPGLNTYAEKIFSGINSYNDFVNATEGRGIDTYQFVGSKIGYGLRASELKDTIEYFRDELEALDKLFKCRVSSGKTMFVAITGRVTKYGRYTREEFVKVVNDLGKGKLQIQDSEALESVKAVVADSVSSSRTYKAGVRRGVLMNSNEFIEFFKKEVSKYE